MITSKTLKYWRVLSRSSAQLDLKPIRSMFGESLPRPASVKQDFAPSSKLLVSVTV